MIVKKNEAKNVTELLKELFKTHGFESEEYEEWIIPEGSDYAMKGYWYPEATESTGQLSIEVFITDDKSKAIDKFTHMCLVIEDRAKLIDMARQMNYEVIKVPRKDSDVFYLFLKDKFGNLYEIK